MILPRPSTDRFSPQGTGQQTYKSLGPVQNVPKLPHNPIIGSMIPIPFKIVAKHCTCVNAASNLTYLFAIAYEIVHPGIRLPM